jgi:hypothetical protein
LLGRGLINAQPYGPASKVRFQGEAEVGLQAKPAGSVENDPSATLFAVKVAFAELIFERVVDGCMAADLVKGEGFAADASAMEANGSPFQLTTD